MIAFHLINHLTVHLYQTFFLIFLHQVTSGAADKSWGVHVARLAGVPDAVIDRARDLLLAYETRGVQKTTSPRRVQDADKEQSLLFD